MRTIRGCRTRAFQGWTSAGRSGAYPDDTVNAVMENRHRILLGLRAEIFRGSASEEYGVLSLLDRAKRRFRFKAKTLGADEGFPHKEFIKGVVRRDIHPHIAADTRGSSRFHQRVRMRRCGEPYQLVRASIELPSPARD